MLKKRWFGYHLFLRPGDGWKLVICFFSRPFVFVRGLKYLQKPLLVFSPTNAEKACVS